MQKIILFQSHLRKKCFTHNETGVISNFFAIESLNALKIKFVDSCFSDFDVVAYENKIFQNPFYTDLKTLAPAVRMEIIDL